MRSIDEYKASIGKLASDLQIQGDHVTILTNMIAYALYTNELNLLRYTKEQSLTNSNFLSSKIQHAMDRMYSVYRGKNPVVEVKFYATKAKNYEIGDTVYESGDYYLYAAEDKEIIEDLNNLTTLKVMVAGGRKKVEEFSGETGFYIELGQTGLSEDIRVRRVDALASTYYDTTRVFKNHIDRKDSNILFTLTTQDYGVRIYKRDQFKSAEKYEVESYPFFDNFKLLESTILSSSTSIQINGMRFESCRLVEPIIPKEVARDIEYNAKAQIFSNGVMKSNTDIVDLFRATLVTSVADASHTWNSATNRLHIYYVLSEGVGEVSGVEMDNFKTEIDRSYYLGEIPSASPAIELVVPILIDVKTYLSVEHITKESIREVLKTYERKIVKGVRQDDIHSALSKLEGVKYVTLTIDPAIRAQMEQLNDLTSNAVPKFVRFNPNINVEQDAFTTR